jgi:hypothetical protein
LASPILKIIFGAILAIGTIWWGYTGSSGYPLYRPWINDFITAANAIIPVFVFLIGIFIVWLELDELKIEAELKTEEKKIKKKK